MNFRQQLQEAYEAGYRSGLNESNGTFGGGTPPTPPTPPVPGNPGNIASGKLSNLIRNTDDLLGRRPITKKDRSEMFKQLLDAMGFDVSTPPPPPSEPGGSSPF